MFKELHISVLESIEHCFAIFEGYYKENQSYKEIISNNGIFRFPDCLISGFWIEII